MGLKIAIQFTDVAAANDLAARLVVYEGWTIDHALEMTAIADRGQVEERMRHHIARKNRHAQGKVGMETRQATKRRTSLLKHLRLRPLHSK